MRIGIVICSSSDLPLSFIQEHDLNIMPITLKFPKKELVDVRDPVTSKQFYKDYLKDKNLVGESVPFTAKEIGDWFLEKLVLKYDRVLVLANMSSRSPIFKNATEASFAILSGYRDIRRAAEVKGSFSLRVLDTQNLFTAEALAAYEAVRLLKEENISFANLRSKMEHLFKHTYGYVVPNDLYYVRNVARKKGDRSLGLLKYTMARTLDIKPILQGHLGKTEQFDKAKGFDAAIERLFDHARWQIENGLMVPAVCMSYAGDPEEFTQRKDYQNFIKFCEKKDIAHTMSVMSITAGVNIGPGSFSMGFATDKLVK